MWGFAVGGTKRAIWRHRVGHVECVMVLWHCNITVNTHNVQCLHSGPQSYTVGQQWDTPPVKIAPVATSKSAICRSFCPHYKQRTGQAWINIVTDLGDNSMPDISKRGRGMGGGGTFAHQNYWRYDWGGPMVPMLSALADGCSVQVCATECVVGWYH